jgi:hypothetical protein
LPAVLDRALVGAMEGADDTRADEARLFGRYLVGREPSPAHVERYVAACHTHFASPLAPEDAAVLAWIRHRPWSIGMLDAACGLLRPGGALRNRVLLMAAILETSPEFADDFLPHHSGPLALVLRVGVAGAVAVANALAGAILLQLATRRPA